MSLSPKRESSEFAQQSDSILPDRTLASKGSVAEEPPSDPVSPTNAEKPLYMREGSAAKDSSENVTRKGILAAATAAAAAASSSSSPPRYHTSAHHHGPSSSAPKRPVLRVLPPHSPYDANTPSTASSAAPTSAPTAPDSATSLKHTHSSSLSSTSSVTSVSSSAVRTEAESLKRRLWFRKKSGGSATSLIVTATELVDDVKIRILQKYPTSLQQRCDPADLVMTVPQPSGIRLELQPDENIVEVIDRFFPDGMRMNDALEVGPSAAMWCSPGQPSSTAAPNGRITPRSSLQRARSYSNTQSHSNLQSLPQQHYSQQNYPQQYYPQQSFPNYPHNNAGMTPPMGGSLPGSTLGMNNGNGGMTSPAGTPNGGTPSAIVNGNSYPLPGGGSNNNAHNLIASNGSGSGSGGSGGTTPTAMTGSMLPPNYQGGTPGFMHHNYGSPGGGNGSNQMGQMRMNVSPGHEMPNSLNSPVAEHPSLPQHSHYHQHHGGQQSAISPAGSLHSVSSSSTSSLVSMPSTSTLTAQTAENRTRPKRNSTSVLLLPRKLPAGKPPSEKADAGPYGATLVPLTGNSQRDGTDKKNGKGNANSNQGANGVSRSRSVKGTDKKSGKAETSDDSEYTSGKPDEKPLTKTSSTTDETTGPDSPVDAGNTTAVSLLGDTTFPGPGSGDNEISFASTNTATLYAALVNKSGASGLLQLQQQLSPTLHFSQGKPTVVPQINILIVEDNPVNQKILEAFMKRKKVRFDVANNGREALEKWKVGGFHLILMDIQLPVMTGFEATKEIRRLEIINGIGAFPQAYKNGKKNTSPPAAHEVIKKSAGGFRSPVIIVALTASSDSDDKSEALAAGCNDFLTKPVNFMWLEKKIIEWGCMQALIDFDGWKKWNDESRDVTPNQSTGSSNKTSRRASGHVTLKNTSADAAHNAITPSPVPIQAP